MHFSEEEVEEFKVKKSSQSKRLAKRREKEKLKRDVRTDGDSNKYDSIPVEVRWTAHTISQTLSNSCHSFGSFFFGVHHETTLCYEF